MAYYIRKSIFYPRLVFYAIYYFFLHRGSCFLNALQYIVVLILGSLYRLQTLTVDIVLVMTYISIEVLAFVTLIKVRHVQRNR